MFGGCGAMIGGNISCGVIGNELIVRLGPKNYAKHLGEPGARPFDFTGRPMEGWVYVNRKRGPLELKNRGSRPR